jgi:Tfp pilus assembly protein PilF
VQIEAGEGIAFVENQSVDLAVRQEFMAATSLLQEERYAEGIALLNKVIKGSHNNSAPYINIAVAYGRVGDMASAEQNLKQALTLNPRHPVALNEYALLLRRTGRYAQAREQYQALLALYPVFMPARKNLGILCELYLNDQACAKEQYELYSEANPDDGEVKLWLTVLTQ